MARRRPTEPTVNPARGAALVVVAVLLGLVLLRNGLDTSQVVTSSPSDSSSTDGTTDDAPSDDGGTDDAATDEGTDGATTTLRPPAEVTVAVLNGTTVAGAAGKYSTAIGGAGYQMADPGDAPEDQKTAVTVVYFTAGFEAEAAAVAAAAGAATVTPTALPEPPPVDAGEANVVVVVGDDLANTDPPDASAGTDGAAADDT